MATVPEGQTDNHTITSSLSYQMLFQTSRCSTNSVKALKAIPGERERERHNIKVRRSGKTETRVAE